jgi:hypothetical protein
MTQTTKQAQSVGTYLPLTVLGRAAPGPEEMTAVVQAALERRVEILEAAATPVGPPSVAIGTEAAMKVQGTAHEDHHDREADPVPWTVFVKVLRSPRHWPGITMVPAPLRQGFIDTFPWRVEADALGSDLPSRLPPGIRTPRVYWINELGDDRVALWLEYIDTADAPWTTHQYAAAARLLGRWAGRRIGDTTSATDRAGYGLRSMADGLLTQRVFPQLNDEQSWAHPLVSGGSDRQLHDDLLALSRRVPALLDTLAHLPQSIGHGDACPQNLLVPKDTDSFVAIDISWQTPEALGFDLGQLLIGRAHTGQLGVQQLPALHDVLLSSYLSGLAAEGHHPDPDAVRFGCDAALVIRSGFTALPLDALAQPAAAVDRIELSRRLALTRYITDLGLALPS